MQRFLASVLVYLFICTPVQAQNLRDPQFMARVQPAFDDIFNMDYTRAERSFQVLAQQHPGHPAPPLYLAAIIWMRELMKRQDLNLDRFVSPSYFNSPAALPISADQRKMFFACTDRSESLAKAILAKSPRDKDAEYFLGSSYAIRGAFIFTIDRGMKNAFGFARRSYQINRKLIQSDPGYYDAYMGVGLYEYMMGSLPWFYKLVLSILGHQGSKEKGFEYLRIAVEKGPYVSRESEVIRVVMQVREQRYAEALMGAQMLHRQFPRNYLFALNVAQIREKMGEGKEAVSTYMEVLRNAEEKKPNYSELPLNAFRYSLGEKLVGLGRPDLAEEQFRKSIDNPQTQIRERALSHLRLGYILEAQGKGSEASALYRAVLSMPDFENSHQYARSHLK
jgi:tetratricopeptide (TPR) repeat protein